MIVVDTHAVIWLTQQQTELSPAALQSLLEGRRSGDLAIADITLNELSFLITRRKVTVSAPLRLYLSFVESMFQVLPISGRIAEQALRFGPSYPKDPADRLIGATTVVHEARLITKDQKIRASGMVECIW